MVIELFPISDSLSKMKTNYSYATVQKSHVAFQYFWNKIVLCVFMLQDVLQ